MLRRSDYGRKTFFRRDGHVKRAGDILRQPELARFLTHVQREGSAYMYSGEWASACVAALGERGGRMTLEDLGRWRPAWHEPWRISYGGYDLLSPAGRQYGGIWVALALFAAAESRRSLSLPGSAPARWAWWAFIGGLTLAIVHTQALDRE